MTSTLSPSDLDLYGWLEAKSAERAEKYTDFAVIDRFPVLTTLPGYTYIGSFSWSAPAYSWRRIATKAAMVKPWSRIAQTPTEITRDYLAWKYPRRLRASREQARLITAKRLPPGYAEPGTYEDMVYIDLKSAYWEIVRLVGWDVDYYPGKFLAVRSSVDDYPLSTNKAARSSLVSSGVSTRTRVWTGKKLEWVAPPKRGVNFGLWALVQDVLNGVASDVLTASPGCVYINTDGFIVPDVDTPRVSAAIHEWGLDWSAKGEGRAIVQGLGIYSIGNRQTRTRSNEPRPMFRVHPVHADWLRRKMLWLSTLSPEVRKIWDAEGVD